MDAPSPATLRPPALFGAADGPTVFLATREHGLAMCLAIAERLQVPVESRILLVADTSRSYEVDPSFPAAQWAPYRGHFGTVVDWNALIWPARAQGWDCAPGSPEARLFAAAICAEPQAVARLVVESIQVPPARALAKLFATASLELYSDGLMTYGGRALPRSLSARVDTLHYRDLLGGLRPRLLDQEPELRYAPYPIAEVERFAAGSSDGPEVDGPTAVILQQYLARLGLLSVAEEHELTRRMVEVALAQGAVQVLVKAHPADQGQLLSRLDHAQRDRVRSFESTASVESWLIGLNPEQRSQTTVYSGFSTGLASALQLGARAVAVGSRELLGKLGPRNGNRPPVAICDSICDRAALSGPPQVRPARLQLPDDGELDLLLELLAYTNDPAGRWRTRSGLAGRLAARPDSVRDRLVGYLPAPARRNLVFLTPDAPPPLPQPPRLLPESDTPARIALSVIIPARNAAGYLPSLAASVIGNAAADIEWVIVDDGSTDDTWSQLSELAEPRDDIRLERHPQALGPSAARNTGLRLAQGTYVTFMDVDDWLAPGYLPRLRDEALHHRAEVVRVSYTEVIGQDVEVHLQPVARLDVPLHPRELLMPVNQPVAVDLPQPWLNVCHREFLLAHNLFFDPELHTAEDREWTWRLFLSASSVVTSSTMGYFWRREVAGSLTQIGDARQLHYLAAYTKVAALVSSGPERCYLPKVYRSMIAIGISHLERSQRLAPGLRFRAVRELRRAVRSLSEPELRLAMIGMNSRRTLLLRMIRVGVPSALVLIAAGIRSAARDLGRTAAIRVLAPTR